jgi:hypothetical protein
MRNTLCIVVMGIDGDKDRLKKPKHKHANRRDHEKAPSSDSFAKESSDDGNNEVKNVQKPVLYGEKHLSYYYQS